MLTDREEMSDLHRGHSIDASCHVSVNLAKRFQRRRFKKIGQSETRIACGGPCLVILLRVVFSGYSVFSDLWQIDVFLWLHRFSTNKTHCHGIIEILLKVVLNTIYQTKSTKHQAILSVNDDQFEKCSTQSTNRMTGK